MQGCGEKFLMKALDPLTKHIYIIYRPKVAYGMSCVAVLVSTVFTSLAAPRWWHLAKIKCGK